MPPAKSTDTRPDAQTVRERQIAAAAHARNAKKNHNNNGAQSLQNGSSVREITRITDHDPSAASSPQAPGMAWQTAPLSLLNQYRVSHNIQSPAAFTTPLHQALLSNPGIGRQSPTMARKKEKRRISKEQLALAVRKNFNGAAVSEIDVVVELVYKVRNQDKAFRMRSTPSMPKKL